jgi:hypothetical protein
LSAECERIEELAIERVSEACEKQGDDGSDDEPDDSADGVAREVLGTDWGDIAVSFTGKK